MNESNIQQDLKSIRAKLVAEIKRDEKERDLALKRVEKNKALLQAINGSLGANRPTGDYDEGLCAADRFALAMRKILSVSKEQILELEKKEKQKRRSSRASRKDPK